MMSNNLSKEPADLTIDDICERCGLPRDVIATYVEEGLIEVAGPDATRWKFTRTHIIHIQKAHRLEKDLGLNPAGSVLVLEMQTKIETLTARLRAFEEE